MSYRIEPLAPHHAARAARLHIDGQPGTFLSSMGPEVLEAVYARLPQSEAGFGFVAVAELAETAERDIIGFVSATTSVGSLFVDTAIREAGRLVPSLMKRFAKEPSLIGRSVQTVFYPLIVRDTGQENEELHSSAELLSIMVDDSMTGQGIGAMLMNALMNECSTRGITRLDVSVDASNEGARRFYSRHGFEEQKTFQLYGREMSQYGVKL